MPALPAGAQGTPAERVVGPFLDRQHAGGMRPVLEGGRPARMPVRPLDPLPREPDAVDLDADCAGEPLSVRFARAGDRFHALGAPGSRPLGRFLCDAGVPREERGGVPLVLAGAEIAWVAGVRPGERFRVRPETRQRLRLRIFDPAPPPEPAQSGQHGVPSARVPPKPYGETGSISVSEATGRSMAKCAAAAPPPIFES